MSSYVATCRQASYIHWRCFVGRFQYIISAAFAPADVDAAAAALQLWLVMLPTDDTPLLGVCGVGWGVSCRQAVLPGYYSHTQPLSLRHSYSLTDSLAFVCCSIAHIKRMKHSSSTCARDVWQPLLAMPRATEFGAAALFLTSK